MDIALRAGRKGFLAPSARVRSYSRVRSVVHDQIVALRERLAADPARERFHPRVRSDVPPQIGTRLERLAADVALVRPFARARRRLAVFVRWSRFRPKLAIRGRGGGGRHVRLAFDPSGESGRRFVTAGLAAVAGARHRRTRCCCREHCARIGLPAFYGRGFPSSDRRRRHNRLLCARYCSRFRLLGLEKIFAGTSCYWVLVETRRLRAHYESGKIVSGHVKSENRTIHTYTMSNKKKYFISSRKRSVLCHRNEF